VAICERCKQEIAEENRRAAPNPYQPYGDAIFRRVHIDETIGLMLAGQEWSPCWLWTGGTNAGGYGVIKALGKATYVHRVAYMAEHGVTELQINHQCDNKLCANPRHLKAGTQLENMSEITQRKPWIRGVRYGKEQA
jgi:hypothetical protein